MLIIKVQNTTDLAPVSDYRYEVLVNLEVIASGEVKGHVRADGWAELVRRVIEPYLVKSEDDILFCSVCGTPIGTDCAAAQPLDLVEGEL